MTLEEKIANADKVLLYYSTPWPVEYAIVEYGCRQGKPLKVAGYYIYGEDLKTGAGLKCWTYAPSTNFSVIEDSFKLEEEAKARMKELRRLRKEGK